MLKVVVYGFLGLFIVTGLKATEVNVELKGVDVKDGVIYLTICDEKNFVLNDEKSDAGKDCFAGVSMRINGASVYKFTFSGVKEGEWAIFGYIDENMNGKLDKTENGLPKESVIFSRELKGEPRFRDIKSVIKGEKQDISLVVQ